ncbi:hypothetical protein ACFQX9_01495 [Bradyrhizobium sp. GCM10028915]|uniref:hypothetical protein n=1 Tax=Bradyrhizobium sp. GCM10028915 TaxID=3273385 RepID=UPI00360BD965
MALDHLLGSKIDRIVKHLPTQGDLTYCDQMLVIEGRPEGVPALCFRVFLAGLVMVYIPIFHAMRYRILII